MKRRLLTLLVLVCLAALLLPLTVSAQAPNNGWVQNEDGTWNFYRDGAMVYGEVVEYNGYYYGLDWDGTMITDGGFWMNGAQYWAKESGSLYTNAWVKEDGNWYYFGEDAKGVNDFQKIGNGRYFFYDGYMVTDTIVWSEKYEAYFVLDEEGTTAKELKAGWNKIFGEWYFVKEDGSYAYGEFLTLKNKDFYFDWDGTMAKNEPVYISEGWNEETETYEYVYYFAGEDGSLQESGWQKAEGAWYYAEDYKLVTGWQEIHGVTYYFSAHGEMAHNTVRQDEDGVWYTFSTSGAAHKLTGTGWRQTSYGRVYVQNGDVLTETWEYIDGAWYYFTTDGYCYTSCTATIDAALYIFDENGKMFADGWLYLDGYWYYADEHGNVYTGVKIIDGVKYYFYEDGTLFRTSSNTMILYIKDNFYWINKNGSVKAVMKEGWNRIDHKWYYFQDGQLLTNTLLTLKEGTYGFGNDGAMLSDGVHYAWYDWYIFDENGLIQTGWQRINHKWYYANPDSSDPYCYRRGVYTIKDKDYFFFDGILVENGTVAYEGQIYITNANGEVEEIKEIPNGYTYTAYGEVLFLKDGEYYTGWTKEGYYAENGYVQFRTIINDGENYYFVGRDGKKITNKWYKINEWEYVYAKADGVLAQNEWVKYDGEWYYMDYIYMTTGYCWIDGATHEFDENGVWLGEVEDVDFAKLEDGWNYVDGEWFYYYNGAPVYGNQLIDGVWYRFDYETAALLVNDFANGYYYDANGARANYTGWMQLNGEWYYFMDDHTTAYGIKQIGGAYYGFEYKDELATAPSMVTDMAVADDGRLFVFDAEGKGTIATGTRWVEAGDKWFYVKNDIALSGGAYEIGGKWYAFNYIGEMVADAVAVDNDGHAYYYDEEGVRVTAQGWQEVENGWVYVKANGQAVDYGTYVINGVAYFFYDFVTVA